jgi:hypothetical protein
MIVTMFLPFRYLLPGIWRQPTKKPPRHRAACVVLSMDMTGQGRAKRTHHQLPMFIEMLMEELLAWLVFARKRFC